MVRLLVICFLLLTACTTTPPPADHEVKSEEIALIPQPASVNFAGQGFVINEQTIIECAPSLENEAGLLAMAIQAQTGLDLKVETSDNTVVQENSIFLSQEAGSEDSEAYQLKITAQHILLNSPSARGLFHGIQTLHQMIPPKKGAVQLPGVVIKDKPKFAHRGMLLDCCRHFWSVEVVKKYIDLLAYYKMNVLHWHLTEDQGWRIEIKKYPKLTEVGAWRTEADGSKYGGFYTQEEIREIVAYARDRHINIIPEIEMPGHSMAALAAYPHLACTEGPFQVTPEWGVFKEVYCAGEESTFEFLEDVLTEVMDLFPGEYIHIGGDESPKFRWENCNKCQKRIADEGLHDEHELQSYFIQRMEKFLNEKGRKLIGWDEILEGGLSPGATVQSWRGFDGGIAAAREKHKVVMSPTSHCYLDYGLDAINLEKIYHFNPIPEGLETEFHPYILGGECNMWTEHVPTESVLDSRILPRMIGLSEALWSSETNFESFTQRLSQHYEQLSAWGFEYGFEKIPIAFSTEIENGKIKVSIEKADPDLEVRYTTDRKKPEKSSPVWSEDQTFEEPVTLTTQAVLNDREYPENFTLPLFVHKGLGHNQSVNMEYSPYYTAGGNKALTDGVLGTLDFRDGHWQGYQEKDLEVVIDLGESTWIEGFGSNFYQYNNAWIFAPRSVQFLVSEDGKNYYTVQKIEPVSEPKDKGQFIESFYFEVAGEQARYVKMIAENIGYCPDWHDAAGSPAWLFIDEIIIR